MNKTLQERLRHAALLYCTEAMSQATEPLSDGAGIGPAHDFQRISEIT